MLLRLLSTLIVCTSTLSAFAFPEPAAPLPETVGELSPTESSHLFQILNKLSPYSCSATCQFTENSVNGLRTVSKPLDFRFDCAKDCTLEKFRELCLYWYADNRTPEGADAVGRRDHQIISKLKVQRVVVDGLETRRGEGGKLFVLYPSSVLLRSAPERSVDVTVAKDEKTPAQTKSRTEPAWISLEVDSGLTYYALKAADGTPTTKYRLFDRFDFEK